MSEDSPPEASFNSREGTSLNFDLGLSSGASMETVLAALPPRQGCDTLTSMFFRWHYNMMRKSELGGFHWHKTNRLAISDFAPYKVPKRGMHSILRKVDGLLLTL